MTIRLVRANWELRHRPDDGLPDGDIGGYRGRMIGIRQFFVAAGALLAFTSSPAAAAPREVTAFVHVNVLPMDRERVLRDQTVIVEADRISAIGSGLPLPAGAKIIDGTGKYLSPGLADMHSHSQTSADMRVYLANGVTTILNLGGASSDFVDQQVPLLNRGERPGPYVYLALRIDGTPEYGQLVVKTPEEARSVVRLAKTNGYQFIKVYNNLSAPAFFAIVDEAKKQGLGIAGHYVHSVPLERELQPGNVLVAHLEELMYGLFTPPDGDPLAPPPDSVVPKAIALFRANHGFVVADLVTFQAIADQWGKPHVAMALFARPEAKFAPPEWRLNWLREDYVKKSGSLDRRAAFEARLAKQFSDAGIGLLAGTDAPTIPGVVPGFSLHDDLDRLVAAGLTPFQALSAATRTPGEFIAATSKQGSPFGEIAVGYRADLLLSDANPLKDIATLRHPVGVMRAGHFYTAADLASMMDQVAADYAAAEAMGNPH